MIPTEAAPTECSQVRESGTRRQVSPSSLASRSGFCPQLAWGCRTMGLGPVDPNCRR
jgi:hypothetical protein